MAYDTSFCLDRSGPSCHCSPPAGTSPVVFANKPHMLGAKDLIDYTIKRGSANYDQGCKAVKNKALNNDFVMTTDQTVIFVESFTVAPPP